MGSSSSSRNEDEGNEKRCYEQQAAEQHLIRSLPPPQALNGHTLHRLDTDDMQLTSLNSFQKILRDFTPRTQSLAVCMILTHMKILAHINHTPITLAPELQYLEVTHLAHMGDALQ